MSNLTEDTLAMLQEQLYNLRRYNPSDEVSRQYAHAIECVQLMGSQRILALAEVGTNGQTL